MFAVVVLIVCSRWVPVPMPIRNDVLVSLGKIRMVDLFDSFMLYLQYQCLFFDDFDCVQDGNTPNSRSCLCGPNVRKTSIERFLSHLLDLLDVLHVLHVLLLFYFPPLTLL